MPAVRNFALCAALAIFLDFLLQVTAFVALLALDQRRVEGGRLDMAPCARLPALLSLARKAPAAVQSAVGSEVPPPPPSGYQSLADRGLNGGDEPFASAGCAGGEAADEWSLAATLQKYMARVHAPALMKRGAQGIVLAVFITTFLTSFAMQFRVSRGLEQQVALPRDSYLQHYFADVTSVMRVGPPLFFVVQGLNMSRHAPDVNRVCSIAGCDDTSLLNQIERAAQQPSVSHIAAPAASWVDDFLSWTSPEIPQCCRAHPDGSRCPPPDQEPCKSKPDACTDCDPCFQPSPPDDDDDSGGGGSGSGSGKLVGTSPNFRRSLRDFVAAYLHHGRPSLKQVQQKLPWFLESQPSMACAKGGAGAYTDAIQADAHDETGIAGLSDGVVAASSFRTAYVPLSSQDDFISGLTAVREFAAQLSKQLGLDVYTFSIFHVFFEQYLGICGTAIRLLGGVQVAIFAAAWLLLGSAWGAGLMTAVIASMLVHLIGALPLLGVQLNAVSLVNLTMAVGIAVEFCAHIVHAFLGAPGPRQLRAGSALASVGAAVVSGIALTKLVGVVVLAWAQTQIFEVYYYRMYAALVVIAAAHALVLLPVLLALIGPPPLAIRRPSDDNLSLQDEFGS
jgi:Niemann-Pick C1 protein